MLVDERDRMARKRAKLLSTKKREMLKASKEIKEKAKKKRKEEASTYPLRHEFPAKKIIDRARNIHDLGIDMEHLITWGMFEIDRKSFIGHQAGNTVLV
ncbi:unnamed protein product [Boreogadus saida]